MTESSPVVSLSPSSTSLVGTQSDCYTRDSGRSAGSVGYSTGSFQHVSCNWNSRSDDEDEDYPVYEPHYGASTGNHDICDDIRYDEIDHIYNPCEGDTKEENGDSTCNSTSFSENSGSQRLDDAVKLEEKTKNHDVQSGNQLFNVLNGLEVETVDCENNSLLWVPPDPENDEDYTDALSSDDDNSDDVGGEWGYLRSCTFGGEVFRSRDKSNEEHQKSMKKAVDGHFRALITQLLQDENLPVTNLDIKESWLDIITTLSWDAATFLKPDTSMGGGMDPGGYVKVKCVACGSRNESMVVKGIVCKKNVAHRRMTSRINKARLLLLGGALEYQRISNHLSSFDTLLQQEMDHLKMAVAKIDSHHPNVLLVEKSVSRCAQEYLLAKDISLVLNIKRPLLERIARCTGAQIIPSIDHLSAPKLGCCDLFQVEKFLETLGSAGQGGKRLSKTLMFFEGCPRPLGCTILLKGGCEDELKKVKHVVHYGVFAAYHLALETSFLADEGASMPELPLTSPINVALPDKSSGFVKSISVVPNFNINSSEKPQELDQLRSGSGNNLLRQLSRTVPRFEGEHGASIDQTPNFSSAIDDRGITSGISHFSDPLEHVSAHHSSEEKHGLGFDECYTAKMEFDLTKELEGRDSLDSYPHLSSEISGQGINSSRNDRCKSPLTMDSSELMSLRDNINHYQELASSKEDFPLSPSVRRSILVSLSSRCVWKGSVCERAHLFRIQYYGSFDKPLGRFLHDHLFNLDYRCHSCEMPVEAHVLCYTHRQGSLTISVKKLPAFLLPGEREGKIWMWHRCLCCPRISGLPPVTKRVVMSDAAWGLSFGKFLELSFSNHAAASRAANCGHSLHRDCLRFYGFGRMVACFRYAPINVHSVHLPPPNLEFNYEKQEWLQKELDEVTNMASLLFMEVAKVLLQMFEQIAKTSGVRAPGSIKKIAELELMLQYDKEEFEILFGGMINKEATSGQPEVDILDINSIKRRLIFHSYVWDQRLIHFSRSDLVYWSKKHLKEKPANSVDKPSEIYVPTKLGRGFRSCESFLADFEPEIVLKEVEHDLINASEGNQKWLDLEKGEHTCQSSGTSSSNQLDAQEFGNIVRRVQSMGQLQPMENLSDNINSVWTSIHPQESRAFKENVIASPNLLNNNSSPGTVESAEDVCTDAKFVVERTLLCDALPIKGHSENENPSWVKTPFSTLYKSCNDNGTSSTNALEPSKFSGYNPVYISFLSSPVHWGGARLLLPAASVDIVVPVYDDEPTSIISYALVSPEYKNLMSEEPKGNRKDSVQSSPSLSILGSVSFLSPHFLDEAPSECSATSLDSSDGSILSCGTGSFSGLDPLLVPNSLHANVSFCDDCSPGKVRYSVTCYFAKQFEALRRACCPSELHFIRSLSRCKKWSAQGGKSNVFFAKTLDDRFVIKQVTKTELESFIMFASSYFKYMSEALFTGCPTCLAKILGMYQVTVKPLKGGKETRMVVMVMENLLFNRNITRLYDLKGSSRSRYNPDSNGVLLDQNLLETMRTSPIFVGTKSKRLLERAVWNDTSFLASIDVMDYSLLVGVEEEKQELVVGIIDFMRQYTWDKHLETWVKASGILGGPKNAAPTVISPKQYKKRFRKAMSAYFLMVPDQWWSSSGDSQPLN